MTVAVWLSVLTPLVLLIGIWVNQRQTRRQERAEQVERFARLTAPPGMTEDERETYAKLVVDVHSRLRRWTSIGAFLTPAGEHFRAATAIVQKALESLHEMRSTGGGGEPVSHEHLRKLTEAYFGDRMASQDWAQLPEDALLRDVRRGSLGRRRRRVRRRR
ncbi:hypothetical protein ACWEOZ_35305 [Actinoplanes sp. NPDC004185]